MLIILINLDFKKPKARWQTIPNRKHKIKESFLYAKILPACKVVLRFLEIKSNKYN